MGKFNIASPNVCHSLCDTEGNDIILWIAHWICFNEYRTELHIFPSNIYENVATLTNLVILPLSIMIYCLDVICHADLSGTCQDTSGETLDTLVRMWNIQGE